MGFLSKYFEVLLDKWLIPFVLALLSVIGPFLYNKFVEKGLPDKSERRIIVYGASAFVLFILITTLTITLVGGYKSSGPDIDDDLSIYNDTVSKTHYGIEGIATLYDDKPIPFWYESDVDNTLHCWVENNGTSYARIETAKLIIDDYTPLTTDDILIIDTLPDPPLAFPDKVEAFLDLSDLPPGRSEYSIPFTHHIDGSTGYSTPLQEGDHFGLDPASEMNLTTEIHLNSTGLYTYHFEIGMNYFKEEGQFRTEPRSFIYIEGFYEDYKYNREKLNLLFIDKEYRIDDLNETMFYCIEGRTLRIHDTKTVILCDELWKFYNVINAIIVEDGAEVIERDAYYEWPAFNANMIYLPKTLKSLNLNSFIYQYTLPKKIYFGGTEEEWNILINKNENTSIAHYLEFIDITFNCDINTFENELSNLPVDIEPSY